MRPYTYNFLRAIRPFFEIVVFSNLYYKILENIIEHIEEILYKPIKEKHEKEFDQKSCLRKNKILE